MATFPMKFKPEGVKATKSAIKGLNTATKGLTTSLAKIGVAVVGAKKLYDAISGSIELAGKSQGVTQAFNNMGKAIGFTDQSLGKLSQAVDGTVNSVDLMTQANNAMLLGIADSDEQMAELFDTAQRLAKAVGEDAKFGIDSLVTGMGRQSKLMLDNLGIIVDTNKAYEDHAKALGKSASELTDAEKKTAFNNATLAEAKKLVEGLGEEQLTMTDRIAKAKAQFQNLGVTLGTELMPIVNSSLDLFSDFANKAVEALDFVKQIDWEATKTTFLENWEVVANALPKVFLIVLEFIVEKGKTIIPKLFTFLTDTVFPWFMEQLGKVWDPLFIGLQIAGQYVMIGIKKMWNMIKQDFVDGTNVMIGAYNYVAEAIGANPIQLLGDVDDSNLDKHREKIAELKEEMVATDLGGALFGGSEDEDRIDTLNELGENIKNVITDVGQTIVQVKAETNPNNPTASLLDGGASVSEGEINKNQANANKDSANKKKKIKEDKKLAKEALENLKKNFDDSAKEFHEFNEFQKALKAREILMAIPASVTKAYEAGLVPPGPFAMARASIYAGMALSAQMAQLKQLKKAEIGYDGLVTSPTMFLAGEGNKAERVSVTPLNAPNIRGPRGSSNGSPINISFSGNVMDEDYIKEHAIPMIKDAIRQGETLE